MAADISPSEKFSKHSGIFSGSALKLIAVISMLIDHTAYSLIYYIPEQSQLLFTFGEKTVTWYTLMRGIGRLAFPIYCFLLSEGFVYTRNRKKYALNLLIFALISEFPWNLLHGNTWFYPKSQNVFFTLFLGLLGMYVLEQFPTYKKRFLLLGALVILSALLHADYGVRGFVLPVLLYLLRQKRETQALSICGTLYNSWPAWLSAIPISFYNGQRGFLKGPVGKYFFYLIYPVHMMILFLLRLRLL